MALTQCFESGVGIEVEYMLVERQSLQPLPIALELLSDLGGAGASEIECGRVRVSNESTQHQIELKSNGPVRKLAPLVEDFSAVICRLNDWLAPRSGWLLPSGMHPFLQPSDVVFWHAGANAAVYEALGTIFDRRTHGWANLQSCHVNLPYASAVEFRELHSAIRILLPILPALAASSPVVEGRMTGFMDTRLDAYRHRRDRLKTLCPNIIPEVAAAPDEYVRRVLEPAYREVRAITGSAVLEFPWINDRGAIARTDRETIEIRIIDAQEDPAADLAISALVRATLADLVRRHGVEFLETFDVARLMAVLDQTIRHGGNAKVTDREYLRLFGVEASEAKARTIWESILPHVSLSDSDVAALAGPLNRIVSEGCLAERIVERVKEVGVTAAYSELAAGLEQRSRSHR